MIAHHIFELCRANILHVERRRKQRCCLCGDFASTNCKHLRRDGTFCDLPICANCKTTDDGHDVCPEHGKGMTCQEP